MIIVYNFVRMWKEKNGRRLYLVLCNGKWLKVVWNQMHYFFLFVLTSRKVGKIFIYQLMQNISLFNIIVIFFVMKTLFVQTTKI